MRRLHGRTATEILGFRIESEIPLPFAPARAGVPDWVVRSSPPPASRRQTFDAAGPLQPVHPGDSVVVGTATGVFVVRFVDEVDFLVDVEARVVWVEARPSVQAETLAHYLADHVAPRLAALGGDVVLHASAVFRACVGAIGFLGPTGSGKSSLATALSRAGWSLMADDGLRIQGTHARVALPNYPTVRLFDDSLHELFGDAVETQDVSEWTSKRRVVLDERDWSVRTEPAPLRTLVVLDGSAAPGTPPQTRRLGLIDAVAAITKNAFLAEIGPHSGPAAFLKLTELAEVVPVHRMTYSHAYADLPRVIEAVDELSSGAIPTSEATGR